MIKNNQSHRYTRTIVISRPGLAEVICTSPRAKYPSYFVSSVCNGFLTQVSSLPLLSPPAENVCKRFGCSFAGEDVATVIAVERGGGNGDEL